MSSHYVYPKEKFDQVGTAVLEINHIFRIRDIRLIQYSSGRRNILFPERICKVDGEFESKRIIEFRENWEEIIKKGIWNAYEKEMKRRNGKEETYGQVKNHGNTAGTERVPKTAESHGTSE